MITEFQCDAVIFDLDGVLVDSKECVESHWRRWADKHGLDATAILENIHGRRTAETVASVAPHLDAELEAANMARAEETDTVGLRQVDGARELLSGLPVESWAVATSGTTTTAITRLRFAKLPLPSVLVSADSVTRGKPDPEPYQRAAAELQIVPAECFVVEDTPAGIESGRAAGMRVVAVASTFAPDALARADAVVAELRDIDIQLDTTSRAGGLVLAIANLE